MNAPGMFHSRKGFFFQRLADGSVRIRLARPIIDHFGEPKLGHLSIVEQISLPENEWASIMASVSAEGETAQSWQAARDFHRGQE